MDESLSPYYQEWIANGGPPPVQPDKTCFVVIQNQPEGPKGVKVDILDSMPDFSVDSPCFVARCDTRNDAQLLMGSALNQHGKSLQELEPTLVKLSRNKQIKAYSVKSAE